MFVEFKNFHLLNQELQYNRNLPRHLARKYRNLPCQLAIEFKSLAY